MMCHQAVLRIWSKLSGMQRDTGRVTKKIQFMSKWEAPLRLNNGSQTGFTFLWCSARFFYPQFITYLQIGRIFPRYACRFGIRHRASACLSLHSAPSHAPSLANTNSSECDMTTRQLYLRNYRSIQCSKLNLSQPDTNSYRWRSKIHPII